MSKGQDRLSSRIGQWAAVPFWVLETCQDSSAIHLYAILTKHATVDRVGTFPGQRRLGSEMGVSRSTVQRALEQLKSTGAVETETIRCDGGIVGTHYILCDKPGITGGPPLLKNESTPAHGRVSSLCSSLEEKIDTEDQEDQGSQNEIPPPTAGVLYTGGEVIRKKEKIPTWHERSHAWCGVRFCVPHFLHDQFTRRLGKHVADVPLGGVDGYYAKLEAELGDEPMTEDPVKWLSKQFDEDAKARFGDSR